MCVCLGYISLCRVHTCCFCCCCLYCFFFLFHTIGIFFLYFVCFWFFRSRSFIFRDRPFLLSFFSVSDSRHYSVCLWNGSIQFIHSFIHSFIHFSPSVIANDADSFFFSPLFRVFLTGFLFFLCSETVYYYQFDIGKRITRITLRSDHGSCVCVFVFYNPKKK